MPYITNLLSINIESVLWAHRGVICHLESQGCEHLILAWTTLLLISVLVVVVVVLLTSSEASISISSIIVAVSRGRKEAWVVISELFQS